MFLSKKANNFYDLISSSLLIIYNLLIQDKSHKILIDYLYLKLYDAKPIKNAALCVVSSLHISWALFLYILEETR